MLSHRRNFSLPKSQPQGPNPSLKAQIPTSRPKFYPGSPNPSLEAQISQNWDFSLKAGKGASSQGRDLGLETGIWASRLGFEGEGQRWRRKSPISVKTYFIDPFRAAALLPPQIQPQVHNQLRQGTGTADHLMLLRLFSLFRSTLC